MNLAFLRTIGGLHCEDCYERYTEVFVFGDSEGYLEVSSVLRSAAGGKPMKDIKATATTSMQVLVLPARPTADPQPKLKFVERPIFVNGEPNMELLVFGNEAGLSELGEIF